MTEQHDIMNSEASNARRFFVDFADNRDCITYYDRPSERASRQFDRIEQRRKEIVDKVGSFASGSVTLRERIMAKLLPDRYRLNRENIEHELASQMIALASDDIDVLIQDCAVREDELTGLSNRRAFREDIEKHLSDPLRFPVALTIIDLDRFKDVNDEYGHEAGDQVLIEAARHLEDICRLTDTTYRLGGDEFAVLTMITSEEPVGAFSVEELKELERRYSFSLKVLVTDNDMGDKEIEVASSSGSALARDDTDVINQVLRAADGRLYQRKREKGNAQAVDISINTASMLMSFGSSVERVKDYIDQHDNNEDLNGLMVKLEDIGRVVFDWSKDLEINLEDSDLYEEDSVVSMPSAVFESLVDMVNGSDLSSLYEFMKANPEPGLKGSIDILACLEHALYSTISTSTFAKHLFEQRKEQEPN